jgi:hypothetical protein
MRFNILFGGKAGQGPNILAQLTGEVLVEKGYYVFYSREDEQITFACPNKINKNKCFITFSSIFEL